jgi:hypothetical protein
MNDTTSAPGIARAQNLRCAEGGTGVAWLLLTVPVDLLHVDGRNAQAMAALGTTRLEHSAAILRFHTLTEAMHAQPAALFGLPGTFDHESCVLRKTANRDSAALDLTRSEKL